MSGTNPTTQEIVAELNNLYNNQDEKGSSNPLPIAKIFDSKGFCDFLSHFKQSTSGETATFINDHSVPKTALILLFAVKKLALCSQNLTPSRDKRAAITQYSAFNAVAAAAYAIVKHTDFSSALFLVQINTLANISFTQIMYLLRCTLSQDTKNNEAALTFVQYLFSTYKLNLLCDDNHGYHQRQDTDPIVQELWKQGSILRFLIANLPKTHPGILDLVLNSARTQKTLPQLLQAVDSKFFATFIRQNPTQYRIFIMATATYLTPEQRKPYIDCLTKANMFETALKNTLIEYTDYCSLLVQSPNSLLLKTSKAEKLENLVLILFGAFEPGNLTPDQKRPLLKLLLPYYSLFLSDNNELPNNRLKVILLGELANFCFEQQPQFAETLKKEKAKLEAALNPHEFFKDELQKIYRAADDKAEDSALTEAMTLEWVKNNHNPNRSTTTFESIRTISAHAMILLLAIKKDWENVKTELLYLRSTLSSCCDAAFYAFIVYGDFDSAISLLTLAVNSKVENPITAPKLINDFFNPSLARITPTQIDDYFGLINFILENIKSIQVDFSYYSYGEKNLIEYFIEYGPHVANFATTCSNIVKAKAFILLPNAARFETLLKTTDKPEFIATLLKTIMNENEDVAKIIKKTYLNVLTNAFNKKDLTILKPYLTAIFVADGLTPTEKPPFIDIINPHRDLFLTPSAIHAGFPDVKTKKIVLNGLREYHQAQADILQSAVTLLDAPQDEKRAAEQPSHQRAPIFNLPASSSDTLPAPRPAPTPAPSGAPIFQWQ